MSRKFFILIRNPSHKNAHPLPCLEAETHPHHPTLRSPPSLHAQTQPQKAIKPANAEPCKDENHFRLDPNLHLSISMKHEFALSRPWRSVTMEFVCTESLGLYGMVLTGRQDGFRPWGISSLPNHLLRRTALKERAGVWMLRKPQRWFLSSVHVC